MKKRVQEIMTKETDGENIHENTFYKHADHWDDIFQKEFAKESDRAAVILTASIMDNALHELLKNYFVPNASTNDDMFDGSNAPLSTFSAKITIAHRVGLISSKFTKDLHLIRKIRNEFAHNIHGCSFDDSRVRSRVLELYKDTHRSMHKNYRDLYVEGTRGDFTLVCAWMLWSITSLVEDCEQLDENNLEFGYRDIGDQ